MVSAVVLLGKINSPGFQKSKGLINVSSAASAATVKPLFATDYERELAALKTSLGGRAYDHMADVASYTVDGEWIGDEADLLLWLKRKGCLTKDQEAQYMNNLNVVPWEKVADADLGAMMKKSGNKYVFLQVSIDGSVIGRLVFELFAKLAPKTCTNFEALCTGDMGKSKEGVILSYKGCPIHRIKKGGWMQSGDIVAGDGSSGTPAIGGPVPDESFQTAHDVPGVLGMCNIGHHTAGSQFYVTLRAQASLDKSYVAFGRLVDGSKLLEFLGEMEVVADRPLADLVISDCGAFAAGISAADEDKAAAKLQAIQRSRNARAEIQQRQQAAAKVQAAKRGQRQRAQKKKEDQAAAKMQAMQRGKRTRKNKAGGE